MKKLLLLLIIVPMIGFGQNKYTWKDVQKTEGVVLLKSTKEPVTGIVEGKGGWLWKWSQGFDTHNAVFENGKQISCIAYYKNGEVCHKKDKNNYGVTYYKNGQIKSEGNFIDHKKNGIWKDYQEYGELYIEATYKDDLLNGPYKYYNVNGQLEREMNYKDGKIDGLMKIYDKNGVIKKEIRYKNDKKVKSY